MLAVVSSVETDQQYEFALRDLENKKRNYDRAQQLVTRGWTSRQAADDAQTAYTMATASVAQNATMKSYEQIRAPFDGVVTARFVDVGTLVQNSTTNKTSNQPVLTVADDSKLRVDVFVEQRDVPFVHVGDLADIADGANAARTIRLVSPELPTSWTLAPGPCSSNWTSITRTTFWCREASPM